jgi:hypothetical protein
MGAASLVAGVAGLSGVVAAAVAAGVGVAGGGAVPPPHALRIKKRRGLVARAA